MLIIDPVLKTSSTMAAIQQTTVTLPLAYGMDSSRTKPTTSHKAMTKAQAHSRSRAYIASMRLDRSDPDVLRPKLSDVMYYLPRTRAPMVLRFQRAALFFCPAASDPARWHTGPVGCSLSGIFHSSKDMPAKAASQQESCPQPRRLACVMSFGGVDALSCQRKWRSR